MQKEFCPYEQALELKELGFDGPCFKKYISGRLWSKLATPEIYENIHLNSSDCLAPLYQQAFHFFRNKYGLMHIINPYDFTAEINYLNKRVVNDVYGDFIPHDHLVDAEGEEIKHLSYEDAELACLIKLIEIVKNNMEKTLEEVALKLYPEEWDWREREIFIDGAKWMQERMYSEKDLRYAFECATDLNPSFESFNAWFKQFKKK